MKLLIYLLIVLTSQAGLALDSLQEAEDRKQMGAKAIRLAVASHDATTRSRAAFALGRILKPEAIPTLLKLLKDGHPLVREAAAYNIGQFGWQSDFAAGQEPIIQKALVESLKDTKIQLTALEALGKVGLEKTPEYVEPYLKNPNAQMRAAAIMALYRHRLVLRLRDPEGKEPNELRVQTFQQLAQLAEDQDPIVRKNAAYYFSRTADARGEKLLAGLTIDKDKWTRLFAVMGLNKMKAKNSKPVLERALKDSEFEVRLAAVQALISAGESVAAHRDLKTDKAYQVRAAWASGLKGSASPQENADLNHRLQKDPSAAVNAEALKSLARDQTTELEKWLSEQLQHPSWPLREAAAQASVRLLPEARERFLNEALKDTHKLVRAAALESMGTLTSSSAWAVIEKALRSNELIERSTAVNLLKEKPAITENDQIEKIETAWETYSASTDRKWVEVRQELVDIIAKINQPVTTKFLRQMAQDPDASVQSRSLRALVARGVQDLPQVQTPKPSLSRYRRLTFKNNPRVHFKTTKGDFVVECFTKEAPIHVADFIGLVRAGFYNGTIWHRIVPNFVVQGGDRDNSGMGDNGYFLRAEINRLPYDRGTLGMPRSNGFNTGGSQLFFSLIPTPHLEGQYTVFGRIVKGVDVLDRLERGDKITTTHVAR